MYLFTTFQCHFTYNKKFLMAFFFQMIGWIFRWAFFKQEIDIDLNNHDGLNRHMLGGSLFIF